MFGSSSTTSTRWWLAASSHRGAVSAPSLRASWERGGRDLGSGDSQAPLRRRSPRSQGPGRRCPHDLACRSRRRRARRAAAPRFRPLRSIPDRARLRAPACGRCPRRRPELARPARAQRRAEPVGAEPQRLGERVLQRRRPLDDPELARLPVRLLRRRGRDDGRQAAARAVGAGGCPRRSSATSAQPPRAPGADGRRGGRARLRPHAADVRPPGGLRRRPRRSPPRRSRSRSRATTTPTRC